MSNFNIAMQFIAQWEWGNRLDGAPHTDPHDLGGTTRYGLAQRFHPDINVLQTTLPEAFTIYKEEYWDPMKGSEKPFAIAMAEFDTAVNCGVSKALKFGAQTQDPTQYLQLRLAYYNWLAQYNHSQLANLNGWKNRVNDLKKFIDIHKDNE